MGVLTDFFIASRAEVESVFRGWAAPLPLLDEFVVGTVLNPFTGEVTTVRSRIPEETVRVSLDAEDQPDVGRFALLDQKGLSMTDLVALSRAALAWDEDTANSEIHGRVFAGPLEASGILHEVPDTLTIQLAATTREECAGLASRWAALFREDAATITHATTRAHMLARDDSEWAARLVKLVELARLAVGSSKKLYMWMTP